MEDYRKDYTLITNNRKGNGLPNPLFNTFLKHPVQPRTYSTGETDYYHGVLRDALQKYKGLGISANQLGIDARVCLIHVEYTELFMVNPVIVSRSRDGFVFFESCLSLPKTLKKPVLTLRGSKITVKTDNLGELKFETKKGDDKEKITNETLQTVVVQHEIDHLDGFTILDRQYHKPYVKNQTFGRNDRIIMKSPEGEMIEVKMKKANDYYVKGYEVI